jgi:hypothetical protein
MRYVLADKEKAILAGFDVMTHNVIDIEGESKMVITEKGMMDTSLLVGDESERLKQLKGNMFDSARGLEEYLMNFKR